MNSWEFRSDQKRSSRTCCWAWGVSPAWAAKSSSFATSSAVGARDRHRRYSSAMISRRGFFAASSRRTRPPFWILPWMVSPLIRCRACERFGCITTSHEQLGVGGGIAHAHVVDRIDDAAAEEVGPDDVRQVAGKVGVVLGGEPLGQYRAAVLALHIRRRRAQELGRHRLAREEMLHLAAAA